MVIRATVGYDGAHHAERIQLDIEGVRISDHSAHGYRRLGPAVDSVKRRADGPVGLSRNVDELRFLPSTLPVVTLDESVAAARIAAPNLKLAKANLDASRAVFDQTRAKNGLSLGASGGYTHQAAS